MFLHHAHADAQLSGHFLVFLPVEIAGLQHIARRGVHRAHQFAYAHDAIIRVPRGLFLFGNCGRGKSILCRFALPAILLKYCRKVVTVLDIQDMNRDIDLALSKHILSLDDIGTEEISVKYGERRLAFAEIMDAAEKQGKLVIVSTNLGESELRERYGDRVLDRVRAITTRVLFTGKSLRQ